MFNIIKVAIESYCSSYQGISRKSWKYLLYNLVNSIAVGVCFFISLYFVDILHLNMTVVGLLMSSYGMGTVVGGVVSGKICDRFSPHLILVISLLFQSIAFLLLAKCNTPAPLLVVLFFLGASTYSFKTVNNLVILNQSSHDQGLRLTILNVSHAASNFGLGISGVAIGVMATQGYSNIFYLAASILILILVNVLFVRDKFFFTNSSQDLAPVSNLKKANFNKLILVLSSVFFVGLVIAQLGSTYPIYVEAAFPSLGTKAVSELFILDTVLIVLVQAPLAKYYRRFNSLIVMGLGAFLMGLGMYVLVIASSFYLAIISCCIWTIGEILFLPTAQLLCYESGNSAKKGLSLGIFQSTYATSVVVGPLIGGAVYSSVGASVLWYSSLFIGVVCLMLSINSARSKATCEEI